MVGDIELTLCSNPWQDEFIFVRPNAKPSRLERFTGFDKRYCAAHTVLCRATLGVRDSAAGSIFVNVNGSFVEFFVI